MIHLLLYRLAIGLYSLGIRVSSLFNPKARLFIQGRRGLLTRIKDAMRSEQRPRIWVHCASLGEFEQGRPVIEALRVLYPQYAIVLTFFSPSGYEVRKNYDGGDYIYYLPVDTGANARQFLDAVSPSLCLFIKYELWYGYLKGIEQRNIPAVLVSAIFNKEQGFFKWYGGLQRTMLGCFTRILVQDHNSIELLQTINITNTTISGDTRFDRVIKAASQQADLPMAAAFINGRKVLVAGSTWGEDEELLHKALPSLPADWCLILVPHEVHEAHVSTIEKLYGNDIVKWSDWKGSSDRRVLLVDKVGFLLQLYSYGTAAFIGGGFGKEGVHNVLEAAVYGMPCYYGPVFHKFKEAVELVAQGGAEVINRPDELVQSLKGLADESTYSRKAAAAKDYVFSMHGATGKVMDEIDKILH